MNKLTVKIDGQTVVRRAVAPFLLNGIERVFLVTSMAEGEARKALAGLGPVEVVLNPHFMEGMSSSVKAALPFIEDADGVFFHLGDKPFVRSEQVKAMMEIFLQGTERLLVPRHEGKKGHPVLVPVKPYLQAMSLLKGDKGLREIIENHSEDVVFWDGDEGNVFDIDTVNDIDTLKRRGHRIEES